MTNIDESFKQLEQVLQQAIDTHDVREESIARVNIACALLQLGSPKAVPAFEQALAAVRRAQNQRSEGILSMYFAPHFVEAGDPARALELAQRGEDIARHGRKGHRVLSLLQLARVLYTGFGDADRAGESVDRALAELATGPLSNATDRQTVVEAAGNAALAATQAHDLERAIALARVISPEGADEIERRLHPLVPELTESQRTSIEGLYGHWQTRFAGTLDPRVARMMKNVQELLLWDQRRAQRTGNSKDVAAVCDFVARIQGAAADPRSLAKARKQEIGPLTDDDVVFVAGLGTDPELRGLVPAIAMFELAGEAAKDGALKGRCLRLAGAIGHERRNPAELLDLFGRAEAALAQGADDRLRAEVANEIAVCELNLQHAAVALEASKRALHLAQGVGASSLERMAQGNVANALLQLGRVREALEIFEELALKQAAAGETQMASISGQNIAACRQFLASHPGR